MNPIGGFTRKLGKVPGLAIHKEAAMPIDVERFRDRGYILVKGVFTPEEHQKIRQGLLSSYDAGYQHQDLLSNPIMSWVLMHPNLVATATTLLGGPPTYFGDGSVSKRPDNDPKLHRDNVDRDDSRGPDWGDDFRIIKFAVYTIPYSEYASGAMAMQGGSHRPIRKNGGTRVLRAGEVDRSHPCSYMLAEAGDVLVWDLRATHAGAVRLAKASLRPVHPKLMRFVPDWAMHGPSPDRAALFFTMGIHDRHLDRWITQLKTVVRESARMKRSFYDGETLERAAGAGLSVLDIPQEIREDSERPRMPIGLRRTHYPMVHGESTQVFV